MSCAEAFASTKTFAIDVDTTDAVMALNSLANQTNYPLLFDFDQVRNLHVNPVKGNYTVSYTHLTLPTNREV